MKASPQMMFLFTDTKWEEQTGLSLQIATIVMDSHLDRV